MGRIQMMSGLTGRIVTVLQENMPATLVTVDGYEGDGISSVPIPNNHYHQWDRQKLDDYPAITMRTLSSIPLMVHPDPPSEAAVRVEHRIELMFHADLNTAVTAYPSGFAPLVLQALMHRYVNAAMTVLALSKTGLVTVADPVSFVENVEWIEPATYGPEEQGDGTRVRTATLPLTIRRHEQL